MSGKGRVYPPVAERLASLTDKSAGLGPAGDCWEYRGFLVSGYGQIKRDGRTEYTHRVAFELHHGLHLGRARETGILVLHRCDNRCCVNPAHLFLGDDKANHADMRRKGRQVLGDQKGESNPQSKLTDEAVAEIRASRSVSAVAAKYGITKDWARTVKRGDAWKHL